VGIKERREISTVTVKLVISNSKLSLFKVIVHLKIGPEPIVLSPYCWLRSNQASERRQGGGGMLKNFRGTLVIGSHWNFGTVTSLEHNM